MGAPLVVLGAPLTIDADQFKTAGGDLEGSLRLICQAIRAQAGAALDDAVGLCRTGAGL